MHTCNDYGSFSHPSSSSLLNVPRSPCGWSLGSMLCALSNIISLWGPQPCTIFYTMKQSMSSPNHRMSIPYLVSFCLVKCLNSVWCSLDFVMCVCMCAFLHAIYGETQKGDVLFSQSVAKNRRRRGKKTWSNGTNVMGMVALIYFILLLLYDTIVALNINGKISPIDFVVPINLGWTKKERKNTVNSWPPVHRHHTHTVWCIHIN